MIKRVAILLVFSISCFTGFSQISTNALTADEAVQTLLGPGVIYSNAQFSGDALQLGYMSGAVNPFEIPSGIALATADVAVVDPNNGGAFINGISGSPDLLSVANSVPPLIGQSFTVSSVNDVATLEFDFIANGTELSFDFIFGSNEYLTYVNTQYNDVFGFFLSGPGITGPYSSPAGFPDGAINIAVIPDSDPSLPVTISSVNPGLNAAYYIDNPLQNGIALNGYTRTLTAQAPLICGETYHIRLSIGDGVDTALDSVVFLEEGSFSIGGQLIQPIVVNPVPGFPPFSVLEGCVQGQFIITPPSCIIEQLVLDITIGGTASLGADYVTNLTDQIIFQPGDDPFVVDVNPLADAITEGAETITISFDYIGLDGNPATASATLNLIDYLDLAVNDMPETFICPDSTEPVTAVAVNGYGPYTYAWSEGTSTATAQFSEGEAGEYEVVATDACGNTASNSVIVVEPSEFVLLFDSIEMCINEATGRIVAGGTTPYSFTFDNLADTLYLDLQDDNSFYSLNYTPINDQVQINVADACGVTKTFWIEVVTCGTVVPNVFTPNGDSENEFFTIPGVNRFPGSSLKVWNRWGVLVYENNSYNNSWRGDDLAEGTYFFIFERSDGDVTSGDLTIFR